MRMKFLGDSFDIVKRSLLGSLAFCGPWSAHPMFTEEVSEEDSIAYQKLLGVPLLFRDMLSPTTDRELYFRSAIVAKTHVFLDPDTGVSVVNRRGRDAPAYLFVSEILAIARAWPERLTLVFDQSVPRGNEANHLRSKLAVLKEQGLTGGAYVSHACFLLVGCNSKVVDEATAMLIQQSGLPERRFLKE
jgi:hypothetical protein